MGRIDTTKINGYETMTAEEKIAALEAYEVEPVVDNTENAKLKALLSKANTEAAENKRKLNEKLTEQEKLEAERAEKEKAMQEELQTLRAEKRVSTYTNKLVEAGYDVATAKSMANSLPDGIGEDYFTSQKTFLENTKKQIEADSLKKQPSLTPGKPVTKSDLDSAEDAKLNGWFGL